MDKYVITSSVGTGSSQLTSFDNALMNCKIANYNLVKVSSILPAACRRCESVDIAEGSVLFTAYASISTDREGQTVSAAIGVGLPKDKSKIGVIMEHSGIASKDVTEAQLKQMIIEAMSSRGYEIEQILYKAEEITAGKEGYATAFAAIAMW